MAAVPLSLLLTVECFYLPAASSFIKRTLVRASVGNKTLSSVSSAPRQSPAVLPTHKERLLTRPKQDYVAKLAFLSKARAANDVSTVAAQKWN